MIARQSINPLFRAVAVIGVVASLVTAVTFAALTSSATLSANTISTATAGLNIANGDVDATSATAGGFNFDDVEPGGPASAPKLFNLKNTGDVPLNITVGATSTGTTGTVDKEGISLCFKQVDQAVASGELCYTMGQLLSAPRSLPGGALPDNGDNTLYQVTAKVNASAVNGNNATIDPFDLIFTGTSATTN